MDRTPCALLMMLEEREERQKTKSEKWKVN
jgi:hypothetical protein